MDINSYESRIPNSSKHGDIVTTPEKYSRSLEVYFVNCILEELNDETKSELSADYKYRLRRRLCQEDQSGSGYCCVPKEITRKLKDPIKFYENAFNFDNYKEKDFSGIDIDTVEHQNMIKTFTGGRAVGNDKQCFYFLENNEWDSTKGFR